MIPKVLENIISSYSESERRMVVSAFECAALELATRTRGNNHPFIEHPLGVVSIISQEIGLMADCVTAVLLHEANRFQCENSAELNHTSLFNSFKSKYPSDIIDIVTGLNNIASISMQQTNLDPEKYRKLIVSYSTDPRVVLIKIADRLEIMRNLKIITAAKQGAKALETMLLYTPLAHQLGLYLIKSEFEDIYFRYSEPDIYKSLKARVKAAEKNKLPLTERFLVPLKDKLDEAGIRYHLKTRTKSPYSIWNKIKSKGVTFEEVYDLFAVRFIIECEDNHEKEVELCWKVYSIVTEEYAPDTSRLRDWISKPRENGYESLHTTVQTADGSFVEVQIRTQRMDFEAEQGHAAHWAYKGVKSRETLSAWLNGVRSILESGQSDIYSHERPVLEEILVFTPTGELRQLKRGATVLDFAFNIHSNLGLKCSGGRINGHIASIRDILNSGDVVDIFSNKNQKPSADWLNFVVTSKARSKIKQKLKEDENKRAAVGKDILSRRLKNWKLELPDDLLAEIVKKYRYDSINEFFGSLGEGKINVLDIKDLIVENKTSAAPEDSNSDKARRPDQARPQLDAQLKNFEYKAAKCCNPAYGDEVFGFLSIKEGIKIHRTDCPNARRLRERYPYRILEVQWREPVKPKKENAEKADTNKGRKGK